MLMVYQISRRDVKSISKRVSIGDMKFINEESDYWCISKSIVEVSEDY